MLPSWIFPGTRPRKALLAAADELDYGAYRAVLVSAGREAEEETPSSVALLMKCYLQDWWHAGEPHGESCGSMQRLGTGGEPGKVVCRPDQLLADASCLVISVGSNGDAAFERHVHSRAPRCQIETWDGTMRGSREGLRSRLPSYVKFHDANFGEGSWRSYADRNVSLLKIDCEGCELDALLPFVRHVPPQQIVMEAHGCTPYGARSPYRGSAIERLDRLHRLMMGLHTAHFRVFASENNLLYSDGTCIEYSLIRSRRSEADVGGRNFSRNDFYRGQNAGWRRGRATIHPTKFPDVQAVSRR